MDPAALEIVSTRRLAAPPGRVFEAFADPARLARWWGPRGFTATIHEHDLRPGGAWRFTMHGPDGADFPNESVFLEVVPPARIVLRHVSAEHPYDLIVSLDEEDGGTRLTWRMIHASESLCARVRPYVVPGNEENFDRLEAELRRMAAGEG